MAVHIFSMWFATFVQILLNAMLKPETELTASVLKKDQKHTKG